ncbi:MAG: hypothetical protein Q7U84_09050, partial [Polynucleobacter sp.]|nr:hypothetical protein [Polynucleobacter sp.]
MTFGYGAKFPAKYQNAYFAADWSYGKLYAVHFKPDGAGYTATAEEFITGQPFPLTDLVVNPKDGAIYIAIGGRKTQSGLYRVTYSGRESTAPASAPASGQAARKKRRALEAFLGHPDPTAVKTLWPYLGDSDRYLRSAARLALEWQPVSEWRERALAETRPDASINALIALVRVSSRDPFHRKPGDAPPDPALQARVVSSLDRLKWASLSESQKLGLLRAYGLTFIRLGAPDDATRQRLISRVGPLFPSPAVNLNLQLSQMLVYLEAPDAASRIVAALVRAPSQEEQIAYARDLRVLRTG